MSGGHTFLDLFRRTISAFPLPPPCRPALEQAFVYATGALAARPAAATGSGITASGVPVEWSFSIGRGPIPAALRFIAERGEGGAPLPGFLSSLEVKRGFAGNFTAWVGAASTVGEPPSRKAYINPWAYADTFGELITRLSAEGRSDEWQTILPVVADLLRRFPHAYPHILGWNLPSGRPARMKVYCLLQDVTAREVEEFVTAVAGAPTILAGRGVVPQDRRGEVHLLVGASPRTGGAPRLKASWLVPPGGGPDCLERLGRLGMEGRSPDMLDALGTLMRSNSRTELTFLGAGAETAEIYFTTL